MAAPLILSVDLRTISDWARDILLNKNLIAINQDLLGAMGRRIIKVKKRNNKSFLYFNNLFSYLIILKYGVNH